MPVNLMASHRILLVLVSCVLSAQISPTQLSPTSPVQAAQPLGPDDLLSLTVANSPELSHQFRIAPDGMLRLPFLDKAISARGRLPHEVEDEIRAALKSQKFFVNPVVTLAVLEYASRPITVMGAVRRPITFQATGKTTLLDALARAEGLAPEAGSTILVTRPNDGPDPEITTVPVRQLLDQPDLAVNPRLYGGEQVRVPEAPRVYVLGNVKHPCVLTLKDPAETTVLKVLTQAEGLAPFWSGEAVIYHRVDDGIKDTAIDLKGILKGKSPDVRLKPYDVLYIPEAKGRRLTVEVLERVVGFGSTAASGLLIYR